MDDINIYRERVALAFDIPCPVCGRKPKCEFTIGRIIFIMAVSMMKFSIS